MASLERNNGELEIVDRWSYNDFAEMEIKPDVKAKEVLSEGQILQAMSTVIRWYDANNGINWMMCEQALLQVLAEEELA